MAGDTTRPSVGGGTGAPKGQSSRNAVRGGEGFHATGCTAELEGVRGTHLEGTAASRKGVPPFFQCTSCSPRWASTDALRGRPWVSTTDALCGRAWASTTDVLSGRAWGSFTELLYGRVLVGAGCRAPTGLRRPRNAPLGLLRFPKTPIGCTWAPMGPHPLKRQRWDVELQR